MLKMLLRWLRLIRLLLPIWSAEKQLCWSVGPEGIGHCPLRQPPSQHAPLPGGGRGVGPICNLRFPLTREGRVVRAIQRLLTGAFTALLLEASPITHNTYMEYRNFYCKQIGRIFIISL